MSIFVATFSAVAVTAAQDLFEIAPANGFRAIIRELRIGQYSDAGDAQAELLSILLMRGHATTGSGGSTITPVPFYIANAPANSTVKSNNTTVATSGSPQTMLADSFNVMGGFRYYPVPDERIIVEPGSRLVARITAPADSLTINGTLLFEERQQ